MNNIKNQVFPNHNVYILGAGFSVDAGLPVIANFLNRMRDSVDWLIEQQWERERKAVEKVFEFRLQAAGAAYRIGLDVENIEELFSLASASEGDVRTSSMKSEQLSNAIAATLEFTQATVRKKPTVRLLTTNKPISEYPESWRNSIKSSSVADKVEIVVPTYHIYAGILGGQYWVQSPQQQNTIITFNYDTLFEDALHEQQIKFTYGLSTRMDKKIEYDSSAKCATDTAQDSHDLPVLKLHGSVNWGTTRSNPERLKVFGNYMELRQTDYSPVLVPPTWRKVFGGALNQVWERARQAISDATRIIVIGFSIPQTDMHFKYLLAAGLRDNISLRQIYFINPDENLKENVFRIFRPELEARGIVQVQPKIMTNPEIPVRFTSDLFYSATQNIINRPLSKDYFLDSYEDTKGAVISISSNNTLMGMRV